MSFAQLKERKDQIQSLIKAAEQAGGNTEKKSYTDERFWKPTVDKAGNGYAVIRFLPAPKSEEQQPEQRPQGTWRLHTPTPTTPDSDSESPSSQDACRQHQRQHKVLSELEKHPKS